MAIAYVNIKQALDNIMQHPLMRDLTFERAVNYTVEFMRIVGVPAMFVDKTTVVKVEDYRAPLPCDFYEMIQVRMHSPNGKMFRYSTDSFHLSDNKSESVDLTYKLQNSVLFASIKEAEIELSYRAILTDDEGYPLLPDNSNFLRALEAYIKQQWFVILFDLGKINQNVLQNAKQEYCWAVGACQSAFRMLSLDQAEAFFNSWRTLLIRDTEHSRGFVNNGSKEILRAH